MVCVGWGGGVHLFLHECKQTDADDPCSQGDTFRMKLVGHCGGIEKANFPCGLLTPLPSYAVISIKCFPWGTNNNKQLLVNVLCQHVPFALLPFRQTLAVPAGPDTEKCVSVCLCY